MSLRTHPIFPTRILYIYVVIVLTVIVGGGLWFMFYSAFVPIQVAISGVMDDFSNDTTTPTWTSADLFMSNIWFYFLIFMLFGLLIYVYAYSQRKGQEVGLP